MKNTIKLWKFMKTLLVLNTLFWITETVFFLIRDGWHCKAISNGEILCDKIVGFNISVFFLLFAIVIINVIDYLLSDKRK